MKIKKSKFRRIIREALLTEVFDSEPYDYSGKPWKMHASEAGSGRNEMNTANNGRETYQAVLYRFEASTGDDYEVSFTLLTNVKSGLPGSLPDPGNPAHYFWDISFDVDGEVDMTRMHDMRVLPTIAKIIADFYVDVLPKLHDSDVKTFGFVGVRESHRDAKAQSKRTRVYLGMIKRYARKYGLNINTTLIPRHHAEPNAHMSDTVNFTISKPSKPGDKQ